MNSISSFLQHCCKLSRVTRLVVITFANVAPLLAAPAAVTLLSDSLLDSKGCLGGNAAQYGRSMNGQAFQNDILLSHNGWQYTAWYDTVGTTQNVLLARRAILGASAGSWQVMDTGSDLINGDEPVWDAHNTISLGLDPRDGTLHLSWDHHGNTLRYRSSAPGLTTHNDSTWSPSQLQSEQNWLLTASAPVTGVTYPIFFNAPDGALFFNYRNGGSTNGSNFLLPWSPTSAAYSAARLVTIRSGNYTGLANKTNSSFTSTSRNAYANGWDFGADGILHYTWTWRESGDDSNHDICYAYSPDRGIKWYNNAGALIADNSGSSGASIPANISVNSPGIVVAALDGRQMLINQQAQTVDNQGRVHVLVAHRRQEPGYEWALGDGAFGGAEDAYYHYVRDPSTRLWTRRQLPLSQLPGSRPDIEAAANGDLYAVFQVSGRLVIAGATAATGYADWTILATEGNNFASEPRIDHARLRRTGVLSVLMQENAPASTEPTAVPIRVLDYAIGPIFEAFAGQDRRLIDYDGDGRVTLALDGRIGASSGIFAVSHRWLGGSSGTTVLAASAAPTVTLAVGTHTLTYEATANSSGRVANDAIVIEVLPAGQITASASTHDGNLPANTLDGSLATRWSASGLGQSITWDLGDIYLVRALSIAFYLGDQRVSYFDLQSSLDGITFTPLLSGRQSSGASLQLENFDFPDLNTRYLRYVGQGNSQSLWNSLTEIFVDRIASSTDIDADGLPDSWERYHFAGSLAPTASGDADGDGFDNRAEYRAASLPANPASHPLDTDGDGLPDALAPLRPYLVDKHTLHLWHLDELTTPLIDTANPDHSLRGLLNDAEPWWPGAGGFGASIRVNTGSGSALGIVTYAPVLSSATSPDTPAAFAWHGSDGAFTVEALVKFDTLPTGNAQIIAFDGDGDGSQDRVFQFRLTLVNGAPALQFNPIATGISGSYTVPLPVTGAHTPDTTSWFHAAVTYDGRAGVPGNLKLYWTRLGSGASQAMLLGEASTLSSDFDQTIHQGDFSLGNEARASGGSSEVFPGRIDEVRISSIARAATDFLFQPHDTDSDGLPDAWELGYFGRLDVTTASSDRDNDGTPDRLEWLLDLNPRDATSCWRATMNSIPAPGSGFTLSWPARAGLRFRVERTTNLMTANWETVATVTTTSSTSHWTDTHPPQSRAFYRLSVTPP